MNNEKKESIQYRFSGYNFVMLQLDSTGPAYPIVAPHPYYRNQPLYWQPPFWTGSFAQTSPSERSSQTKYSASENFKPKVSKGDDGKVYPLLPFS